LRQYLKKNQDVVVGAGRCITLTAVQKHHASNLATVPTFNKYSNN